MWTTGYESSFLWLVLKLQKLKEIFRIRKTRVISTVSNPIQLVVAVVFVAVIVVFVAPRNLCLDVARTIVNSLKNCSKRQFVQNIHTC